MTCSIAYKESVIKRIGGFNERFIYQDYRGLALRVIKLGRIRFNPELIVCRQKIRHCPNSDNLILAAKKSRLKLYFAVDFQ